MSNRPAPIHPASCHCARCTPNVRPAPSAAAALIAVIGFAAVLATAIAVQLLRGLLF